MTQKEYKFEIEKDIILEWTFWDSDIMDKNNDELEMEIEFPDYGSWSGVTVGYIYSHIKKDKIIKLRDFLNKVLDKMNEMKFREVNHK